MNSKQKQNIIESYNFNIGVAIALIFKGKDLKHVRNHINKFISCRNVVTEGMHFKINETKLGDICNPF